MRTRSMKTRSILALCFRVIALLCVAAGARAEASTTERPFFVMAPAPQTDPGSGGSTPLRTPESYGQNNRFWRATGEIFAQSLIQNLFGKHVMDEKEGFTVTFDTIEENLHSGMNWDDNSFSTNNFRHPYQGGLYYSAGRSNHYDFYQSSLFAFAGSWGWEYLGEAHNPSFNDFVNTAVGGIILGEVMYRLSTIVLDNTATGSSRAWREVGGAVINPVRAFNRIVTGEAFDVHANPAGRYPTSWSTDLRAGIRTLGEEHLFDGATSKAFVELAAAYGSPFDPSDEPFDHFDLGLQLNFDNKPHGIGKIEVQGLLGKRDLASENAVQHVISGYQHFDYLDNEAYTYGGMSFGAGLWSRFGASENLSARTSLHAIGILLGATKNDFFNISGRDYDYGPGAALKVSAVFTRRKHDLVSLGHESHFIHSVNGGAVNSWVTLNRVRFDVPLRGFLASGLDFVVYHSERDYPGIGRISTRNPELRAYVSWRM